MAADQITWPDKTTGDTFSGAEATEVKDVVNNHAVLIDALETATSNIDNTSDVDKPVSTAQAAADAAVLVSAQLYADGLVVGLWDDRGNFDASVNAYPSSGGSGSAGAIKKGDIWTVSVAGTLPTSKEVGVGDTVRALIDTPGNTQSNWAIAENNIGYVPENVTNKGAASGYAPLGSDTKLPSANAPAIPVPATNNTAIAGGESWQQFVDKIQSQINSNVSNLSALNATSAKRRGAFSNLNIVGYPSRGNQYSQYSDSIVTTETSKVYAKNIGDTTELSLYFTNFSGIMGATNNGNDITIEASIEHPAGTFTRVTFENGNNTFLLKNGFGVKSDFIKIYIPANTPYAIRTNVLVASGEKWLRFNYAYNGSYLGTEVLEIGVNKVMSGTMSGAANPYVYSPTAILGISNTRKASILLKGDSRSQGSGDSGGGAIDYGDHVMKGGLYGRALADNFPYLNCGLAGQKISHWTKGQTGQSKFFDEMLSMCQFCLTNLGINDLIQGSSATTVQTRLVLSWDTDLAHGLKTYQTTLEPVTTSTDGWATVVNQTVSSFNGDRIIVNTWLRDGAPIDKDTRAIVAVGVFNSQTVRVGDYRHPLKGVFDTALLAESSLNSGLWKAGYSGDGTHENATGYAAVYLAIDTTVFAV